jgi:hypothetical protein
MTEVSVAGFTQHFCANHAVSAVCVFDNKGWVNRFKVAWPTATRIKLRIRRKKGRSATHTVVNASGSVIPELARKGTLSAFLAGNVVCFGR